MNKVLITGIGRGIGKALAEKFLREGYFVLGTTTTGLAGFQHADLKVFTLDLSKESSIVDCVRNISEFLLDNNTIDILINNAGVVHDDEETKVVIDKLRSTLEVNLIGTISFTEKILAKIKTGGKVKFISSSAGSISRTGHSAAHYPNHYPAYKISKCAINMYMRTLAMRETNKIISSIHPGRVQTPMTNYEGDMTAEESASQIFNFVTTNTESGFFWFEGGKMDW